MERADDGTARGVRGRLAAVGGRRGAVTAGLAVVLAAVVALPRLVPNTPGRVGSLVESFLPWSGAVVVLLLVVALVRRSGVALLALLLPVAAWVQAFGGLLLPEAAPGDGARDLLVVQHNVSDENPDPRGTARALAATGADLLALEELVPPASAAYEDVLRADYPYRAVHGTVGLWSRHPIAEDRPVDIRPRAFAADWNRGLRAVVETPHGEVAAYVVHLPSVRIGARGLTSSARDESARRLGDLVRDDEARAVILMGDLNSTVDDRGLAPLTSRLHGSGRGFAFSFPAAFPVARIDQVLARGAVVGRVRALPATGSDHVPVAARVTLDHAPAG